MFFNSNKTRRSAQARANNTSGAPILERCCANDDVWLDSSQLELGMYVNKLDKPWEQTRFMFQGFVIDSYELLRQVQNSCERANVQTLKAALRYSKSAGKLMASANH